jgi:hypothetical protein
MYTASIDIADPGVLIWQKMRTAICKKWNGLDYDLKENDINWDKSEINFTGWNI